MKQILILFTAMFILLTACGEEQDKEPKEEDQKIPESTEIQTQKQEPDDNFSLRRPQEQQLEETTNTNEIDNTADFDAEEVLEKHFRAKGQSRLLQKKTRRASGKVMQQNIKSDFTQLIKRPNKYYFEGDFQGQTLKQGFDGTKGWKLASWIGDKAVEVTGFELEALKLQSQLDGEIYNWKKKGMKLSPVGIENIDGRSFYVVKIIRPNGMKADYYIDRQNFRVFKNKMKMTAQGQEVTYESFFRNYKTIDGISLPYEFETTVNGMSVSKIIIEKYEFGVNAPDSLFEMP